MKFKTLVSLIVLTILIAAPVMAQDPGTPDTAVLVVSHTPDALAGDDTVQVDLYGYNDESLTGVSAGFIWDNPNLQLDSGWVSSFISGLGPAIGPFFYQDDDINVTNANQQFVFGWAQLMGSPIPAGTTRQLWASYRFTLSSWTVNDSIVIDSTAVPPSNYLFFSAGGGVNFVPKWACELVIYDPNRPISANLVLPNPVLNFSAVEGDTNTPDQTFTIGSDGETIRFRLSYDSTWLSTDPVCGTTGTIITASVDISELPVGTYVDTIEVTSTTALNSPQYVEVNLVVEAPNNPPVLDPIGPQMVNEGENLNFTVSSSDPDDDPIMLTVDTLQTYFTDHANDTGTFDWTPGFNDSGLYSVIFVASDGELADSETVEITVNNVNRPPEITPVDDTTITECDPLVLMFSASDPDGDAIAFTTDTLYDNMIFTDNGAGNALLTFNPDFTQADTYPIILYASDGVDTTADTFIITVDECYNLVLTPDTLKFTAIENGANPDSQLFNVSEIGSGGISFNLSMSATWFGLDRMGGATPEDVVVSVNISGLTTDSTYFDSVTVYSGVAVNSPIYKYISLIVSPAENNPPVLDSIRAKVVEEGQNLNFDVTSSDPDGDPIILTVDTLYEGMTFTDHANDTGTFDWTPNFNQADVYSVTFIVSDGALADSEVVGITVNNVNRPPEIAPVTDTTITECDSLIMSFTATDPDGDDIAFTTDTLYNNMIFTENGADTALLTFYPDFTQAGSYPLTLYVTDGDDTSSAMFTITVDECYKLVLAPDTLKFTAIENGSNPDSQLFNVSEIGGGAIAFNLSMSTTWFGLDRMGGTTPEDVVVSVNISGLTTDSTYFDSVTVSSGAADNSPIYDYISLIVSPEENNPPVLDSIGPKVVNEGEDLTFTISASDPDETIPVLSAVNLPDGATFEDSLNGVGLFVWWPDFDQDGVYYVTFIASDGMLADSEVVEITVNNVNRPPEIEPVADTTIDECDTLELTISATDLDGDSIALEIDTLYANMTFTDNGDGTADFYFAPSFEQAGTYPLTVLATDGEDTVAEGFTITVDECEPPPECVDMILSDTLFHFVDTLDNGVKDGILLDTLSITSSGDEFCFRIWCDTDSFWITVSPDSGCTPALIDLEVDPTGLGAGQYVGYCWVNGDSTVCEPSTQMFTVILDIVDTTALPCEDSLTVATVGAVPGAQVVVPIDFSNCCDLSAAAVILGWSSSCIYLDSVSFADSRLADFQIKYDTINNALRMVVLGAANDGSVPDVPPGSGNFANMYFSVNVEAPAEFYKIDLASPSPSATSAICYNPVFTEDCGEGEEIIIPEFIPGGINVGPAEYDICGYVVDTNGNPIEGAIVELWTSFPDGIIEDTDATDSTGLFGFFNVGLGQFDLWAYHEGYYPRLVEDVPFGETGIMIELTPVEPIYPTYEWVWFFCDYNEYMGAPLPVGSVIDAYDSNGVHCGTDFVTDEGRYGYMPVYRDDPYPPHDTTDEGADPGETINFFINGIEAVVTCGDPTWTKHGDTNQACLEAGRIITKTCDLLEGWNLVSWNVKHETGYIPDVLTSIEGCLELVMGFEQGALIYDPGLPQFSTLWYADHLSGYWIKTSCDVTLEITGAKVSPTTSIPVTTGWNLVSYLPDFTIPTGDALVSIHDDLVVALGWDGDYLIYLPGEEPYNTLTEMGPCYGYWVKVTQNGNLLYPATGPIIAASQKSGGNPVVSAAVPDVIATNRWISAFSHNLTLDGETVAAGATIAAYTLDGAKIGGFSMTQDGLFGFMPIYADENGTPEVEGVRSGERFYFSINGVKTNETFVWTKAGDKMEIGALTTKSSSEPSLPDGYSLNQNYPNPFNPTTNISFTLPVSGKAKIEIFNILGKLVATPFDGLAQAGSNEVTWNGRNFAGETVASGIYFYRLSADKYTETKKMILMK